MKFVQIWNLRPPIVRRADNEPQESNVKKNDSKIFLRNIKYNRKLSENTNWNYLKNFCLI